MALKTDDIDIMETYLTTQLGGNGDYYVNIFSVSSISGIREIHTVRVATSGGNAPTDVKIAIADLFRAMEKHALNNHPEDDVSTSKP